jgi:hypothetical protein
MSNDWLLPQTTPFLIAVDGREERRSMSKVFLNNARFELPRNPEEARVLI